MLAPANGVYRIGTTIEFFAGFVGEVRVASGDVTGDGIADYIGGAGPGGGPRVAIIDGATGRRVADFFSFETTFFGGVFIAVSDVDGDGRADVIVTPDVGGGPVVALYSGAKLTQGLAPEVAQLNRFIGIEDRNFRGGARAAAGDLNGDGFADLIVSAGFLGGPRIAVYNGSDVAAGLVNPSHLVPDFFAFEDTLRDGSYIAAGDVNGDGVVDLAFGAGPSGAPRVRLIDGASLQSTANLRSLDQAAAQNAGLQLANFYSGNVESRGGVRVALRDADGDGRADLVTGSGNPNEGQVRLTLAATLLGDQKLSVGLDPFLGDKLPNGVFVG